MKTLVAAVVVVIVIHLHIHVYESSQQREVTPQQNPPRATKPAKAPKKPAKSAKPEKEGYEYYHDWLEEEERDRQRTFGVS